MKYVYDAEDECFRRIDGLGRPLNIDIEEARTIDNLLDLGYSVSKVYEKLDLSVTIYTLRTFVSNLREGNINLDGDFPLPSKLLEHNSLKDKVDKLENDVKELKEWKNTLTRDIPCDCECGVTLENNKGFLDKVKSWIKV